MKLRHLYHDHVTNSSKLYDPEVMDECVGEGKWIQIAPKICRVQDGFVTIKATEKRREYQRKNMVPCEEYECEPTDNGKQVP